MIPLASVNPFLPQAANASGGSNNSPNPSPSSNQLTGDSFIQLLTAQLRAQNPLNPTDPTTFVTQLVQFNQLEQLIQINQTLSQAAQPTATNTTQPSNSAANTIAPPQPAGTSNL
jgi:flagellar basal-body rod modification protein FlgD